MNEAITFDINQQYEEAAEAYEAMLNTSDASADVYINLACLYWVCVDPGTIVSKRLFTHASDRMYEVLDEAQAKFGELPEIVFWRLYFNFTILGDPPFPDRALELAQQPDATLVPYFHVYDQTKDPEYRPQVEQLLKATKELPTAKNRYIASILE